MPFLHELPDVKQLFEVTAKEKQVIPYSTFHQNKL